MVCMFNARYVNSTFDFAVWFVDSVAMRLLYFKMVVGTLSYVIVGRGSLSSISEKNLLEFNLSV